MHTVGSLQVRPFCQWCQYDHHHHHHHHRHLHLEADHRSWNGFNKSHVFGSVLPVLRLLWVVVCCSWRFRVILLVQWIILIILRQLLTPATVTVHFCSGAKPQPTWIPQLLLLVEMVVLVVAGVVAAVITWMRERKNQINFHRLCNWQ